MKNSRSYFSLSAGIALSFFAAFVFAFSSATCQRHKLELQLCKELQDAECLPPLLEKEVVYYFNSPDKTGDMRKFINDIYFAGDTISFCLRHTSTLKQADWRRDFSMKVEFPEKPGRSVSFSRIKFSVDSVTGTENLGELLRTYFSDELDRKYSPVSSVHLKLSFHLREKQLAYRTLTVRLL